MEVNGVDFTILDHAEVNCVICFFKCILNATFIACIDLCFFPSLTKAKLMPNQCSAKSSDNSVFLCNKWWLCKVRVILLS